MRPGPSTQAGVPPKLRSTYDASLRTELTTRILHGLRRVLQARGDLGDGLELLLATRPGLGPMLARLAGPGEWVG
jgi:hypothetical protein